jgi:hypothetical protein
METPKPMIGTWTLTAPDGRIWQSDSPLRCCGAEQRERVPIAIGLARIFDASELEADESDEALLQTALDALEYHCAQTRPIDRTYLAIAALRDRVRHNVKVSGRRRWSARMTGSASSRHLWSHDADDSIHHFFSVVAPHREPDHKATVTDRTDKVGATRNGLPMNFCRFLRWAV